MRMKKKPEEPKRKSIIHRFQVDLWDQSLQEMVDWADTFKEEGITYSDVLTEKGQAFDDYGYLFLRVRVKESDEKFIERLKTYNKKLEEYNLWYKENKEEIEEQKALRAIKAKEKKQRELNKLLKQAEKLKKDLEE